MRGVSTKGESNGERKRSDSSQESTQTECQGEPQLYVVCLEKLLSVKLCGDQELRVCQRADSAIGETTLLTSTFPWSTRTVSVCLIAPYDLPLTMS